MKSPSRSSNIDQPLSRLSRDSAQFFYSILSFLPSFCYFFFLRLNRRGRRKGGSGWKGRYSGKNYCVPNVVFMRCIEIKNKNILTPINWQTDVKGLIQCSNCLPIPPTPSKIVIPSNSVSGLQREKPKTQTPDCDLSLHHSAPKAFKK